MPIASVSQISTLHLKPTDQKSKQIGALWSEKIKAQSLFSARTTEQSYLTDVRKTLQDVAGRDLTPQQAEIKLRASLGKLGYTPEHGFQNAPGIAVGQRGAMTDLSSTARLRLIMDTNVKQARTMQQLASSEDPIFKLANPAWRLTRVGMREKPRTDWQARWQAAGDAVGWQGAMKSIKDFVALKDSPIWAALGNGAGGFTDTLRSPYPPFAFGSGMGWVNVGRRECKRLGFDLTDADPTRDEVQEYIQKSQEGFDPTRDLGGELPQRYQDAPFAPNLTKGREASAAIARAQAAIEAAQNHLESAIGTASACVNDAEALIEEAKTAGLPVSTAAIDAVTDAIAQTQNAVSSSLGGLTQSAAALAQTLSAIPPPASDESQQAYNAACGILTADANKCGDDAKGQQKACNGAVSEAEALRDKVKAQISACVQKECATYLASVQTVLSALADKWSVEKDAERSPGRGLAQIIKEWKKLDKDTQKAVEAEKRACDLAADKLKKQGNIVNTDFYRAGKELAEIKTQITHARVKDLIGDEDVRVKLRTHGAKWQTKTNKDIEAHKTLRAASAQAVAALEEAITRAKMGYKWDTSILSHARGYGIKVAESCQEISVKISENAGEWAKTLADAQTLITALKSAEQANASITSGVDIGAIQQAASQIDASKATSAVTAAQGEADHIKAVLDLLESQPADPAKQDKFDEVCEAKIDELKRIIGKLDAIIKALGGDAQNAVITEMDGAKTKVEKNIALMVDGGEKDNNDFKKDATKEMDNYEKLKKQANSL